MTDSYERNIEALTVWLVSGRWGEMPDSWQDAALGYHRRLWEEVTISAPWTPDIFFATFNIEPALPTAAQLWALETMRYLEAAK